MNKLSYISNKEVDWMKLVYQYFDDLSYIDKVWKYIQSIRVQLYRV